MNLAAFLAFVLLAMLFAIIAAWTPWKRWPVVVLYAGSLAGGLYVMHSLATGPMPHAWETRTGEAEVVSAYIHEGRAIYLWLLWPDDPVPRSYKLPWAEQTKRQIEEAADQGSSGQGERMVAEFGSEGEREAEGAPAEFGSGFLPNLETREPPFIYAAPQPPNPPKPRQDNRPQFRFGEPGA